GCYDTKLRRGMEVIALTIKIGRRKQTCRPQKEQRVYWVTFAIYDGAGLLDALEVDHLIAYVRQHHRSRIFEWLAVIGIVELQIPAFVFNHTGILVRCRDTHCSRD